jgi:hypothetical protein
MQDCGCESDQPLQTKKSQKTNAFNPAKTRNTGNLPRIYGKFQSSRKIGLAANSTAVNIGFS